MRESCSLLIREYTEGVALSGRIDLIMTDLWRDRKAPKGQRLEKAIISQAKGQSSSKECFLFVRLQRSNLF